MKLCAILNPSAGSAKDADGISKQLETLGCDAVYLTKDAGDAAMFARRGMRNGCDYVIAAGGDGTLNEVINGIAEEASEVQVGLVPLGTGNDFARSLKLPSTVEEN